MYAAFLCGALYQICTYEYMVIMSIQVEPLKSYNTLYIIE